MTKIAVFGGTFNPPHIGHLKIIEKLQALKKHNKIFIIPTYLPPHKELADYISAQDRLNMLNLLFANIDNIEISDIELKKKKISYTYYTVLELKNAHKNSEIDIVIGADNFEILDEWHKINELLQTAKFIVFSRNSAISDHTKIPKNYEKYKSNFFFIDDFDFTVSSSKIRELIKSKKYDEAQKLLNPEIFEYIVQHKLYE